MLIFSDNIEYADSLFSGLGEWNSGKASGLDPDNIPEQLLKGLYGDKKVLKTSKESKTCWQYAFLVENAPASHYDLLLELNRQGIVLPDRILCLAGSGDKFHGQRNRPWAAVSGNIHLTLVFKPERKINNFQACFPALAAVSVVEAIDGIKGLFGRAGIKWVNDVVIDKVKIAGFIAYSQCLSGFIQTAFLGIGLNIETTPEVEPTRFVPEVGMNFAYALKNAKTLDEICAVDGRILKTKEKVETCGGIKFGVSQHVASIVLAAMSLDKDVRSVVNIRFSKKNLEMCKKAGFRIGFFDRKNEPKTTTSTMEWGTKQAIKDIGFVPDIIYDEGGMGKEPMIRLLGENPKDVLFKFNRLLKSDIR